MKAELKKLHSPDVNLNTFAPTPPDCFTFFLQAMIGPEGDPAEEAFNFQVCTPKWLIKNRDFEESVIFGTHMLLVFEYDFLAIEKSIRTLCNRSAGQNWQEIAQKLSRFGAWEFEDYRMKI